MQRACGALACHAAMPPRSARRPVSPPSLLCLLLPALLCTLSGVWRSLPFASALYVTSDGLVCASPLLLSNVSVSGSSRLHGTLAVGGATRLSGSVEAAAGLSVQGVSEFAGAISAAASLSVAGASSFGGAIS